MRLTKAQAKLIQWERVARVATVGAAGVPHLVPVCQILIGGKIYFASGKGRRPTSAPTRSGLTVDLSSDDGPHPGVMVQHRASDRARPAVRALRGDSRKVPAVTARGGARRVGLGDRGAHRRTSPVIQYTPPCNSSIPVVRTGQSLASACCSAGAPELACGCPELSAIRRTPTKQGGSR